MNKKATRLFSMLLAVLMVVTMIPVMALSAQEVAVVNETDPVVWDGKVPASSDGTVATVEEWIFGTGAAEGKTYDFNWSADYADYGEQFAQYEHIEFNGTDTITIKTAAGLALFTVWSNVNTTTVQGMGTAFGNGAGMTHPLVFLQGKTVKLAADLYLNDPAKASTDWTNTTMPIFWDNIDLLNAAHVTNFTFDGQGHVVFGWMVDQEIVYNETNCQNFAWGFFGHIPQNGTTVIKSLALVKQIIKINADIMTAASTIKDVDNQLLDVGCLDKTASPGVCTLVVGGVYGVGVQKNGDLVVEDCIVDLKADVNANHAGLYNIGNRPSIGALFGGVAGSLGIACRVYPEAKNASATYSTLGTNDMAKWRVIKDVVLNIEANVVSTVSAAPWETGTIVTGVGVDGWQNTAYLDNVLVTKFAATGYEKSPMTAKGIYDASAGTGASRNRGLVATVAAAAYMFSDVSNKENVSIDDILDNFDTAVVTETTQKDVPLTTYADWVWEKGNYPMPTTFAAATFINDVLSGEYADELLKDTSYKIYTPEDFMAWKDNLDNPLVKLMNDIDMAGYDWTPIDTWGGTFDGQGYAIYNLTSTPVSDNLTDDYHAQKNMRGGLVNVALDGLTFKNVAFLNYHFKSFGWWAGAHQGMLFASFSGATVTIENVIIAGRNNGGTEVGMFGGRGGGWSGTVNITNCAFICTDPAKTCVNSGFAQASKEHWGTGSAAYGTVNISNFYAVNLPDYVTSQRNSSYNATSGVNASKIYATGPKDVAYYTINFGTDGNDVEDSNLTYADVSPEFYAAIEGDEVTKADMLGSAMDLGSGWTYADGKLPVPKCFGAEIADLLTETNGIKADDASDFLESLGASIRLGSTADKQGIRFMFQTKAALDLLSKNADVIFGVAVLPTALLEDGVLNEDDAKALMFTSKAGGDAVLDVVDGKFNAALVNFAGVTGLEADVYGIEFTVRAFVMVGENVLWMDSYACSATDVANAYIAVNAGSEDATVQATIAKIQEIYGDRLA